MRLLDVTAGITVSGSISCGSSGFHFCFVYSPCRILASLECYLQVFFFCFKQVFIRASGVRSMLQ